MENTFSVKMIFHFYHSVVKAELKRRGFPKEVAKKIEEEHGKIVARAKDIGKSKLLSSYIMASYYITFVIIIPKVIFTIARQYVHHPVVFI